jgi:riboflavin kinase/FMN adenylyltransferase
VRRDGKIISSTRIRRLIASGRLEEASRMLGRPVSIYGDVVRGRGRGRRLGYPTANLNPHHETLPPPGVYAVKGLLGRRALKGVVHIGQRPTFAEKDASVEAHFIGFHGDLYGREAELFFVQKLRPIRRFSGPLALKKAIQKDIAAARAVLR